MSELSFDASDDHGMRRGAEHHSPRVRLFFLARLKHLDQDIPGVNYLFGVGNDGKRSELRKFGEIVPGHETGHGTGALWPRGVFVLGIGRVRGEGEPSQPKQRGF